MAYGSPERLADVPAYYADIRGGRPIAPENLEDLVARYRRLGIEDSNPLNAITEATRAALEPSSALPVFTGMKHWTPRIAEAVDGGARGRRAHARRARARAALQPRSRSPATGACSTRRVAGRAERRVRRELARRPGLRRRSSPTASATPTRTSSSRRTRCLRGSSTRATRTATSCSRPRGSSPTRPASRTGRSRSRASRRPASRGSARTSSTTSTDLHDRGIDDVLVCPVGFVSDHLEIRWDIDTEAQEKARELGMRLERIEMPNADPALRRTCSPRSCAARVAAVAA